MEKIFYSDHDQRYGHIPERERALYPDELIVGHTRIVRDMTLAEIREKGKPPGMRDVTTALLARDVPYTHGLDDYH